MTLFGQTLDPQQMFGLVASLTALACWIVILKRERSAHAWFKQWEADRRARRLAQDGGDTSQASDRPRTGPWG